MWLIGKKASAGAIILCAIFLLQRKEKEDVVLSAIHESGYVGELHHTITEDGHILGIHKILNSDDGKRNSSTHKSQYPILFVHGLESSAADWIIYQGNESLPYLLLKEGYDVWLGNVRGTQASLKHTTFDPFLNSKNFWNSSIHEIGYFDLPAMIDYVLNITKSEKLFYVGISQGEATFLIMASERPQYNDKIKLALLTSPSSHLKYSDNVVLKTLGRAWRMLGYGADLVGLHTVPGRDVLGSFCQYRIFSRMCTILYSPFAGYLNVEQSIHTTKMFQVYPIRSAFKQLLHYLQIYESGIFRQFDHGSEGNLRIYGSSEPPVYDMKKIVAPVSYFWGENDCWSRPKDVADIEMKLPNMVLSYKVPLKSFNHYDIIGARDAKTLAYDKMIETIALYNKTQS